MSGQYYLSCIVGTRDLLSFKHLFLLEGVRGYLNRQVLRGSQSQAGVCQLWADMLVYKGITKIKNWQTKKVAKQKSSKKTSGARSQAIVRKTQPLAKHRHFIVILMVFLVLAIVIVNAMRTQAAPTAPDFKVTVIQQGTLLKASVEPGQHVVAWRALRQSHDRCSKDSFALSPEEKKLAEFQLSHVDHDQYYCFQAQDGNGDYTYRSSSKIDLSGLTLEIAITTRQLDGVLWAEAASGLDNLAWRALKSEVQDCDASVFEAAAANSIAEGNLVVLKSEDSGGRYCIEATPSFGGLASYHRSQEIVDFEILVFESDQALAIAYARLYDDVLIVRATRKAHWQAVFLEPDALCSATAFADSANLTPRLGLVDYRLIKDVGSAGRYCFQAYDHRQRAFLSSPLIPASVAE